MEAAGHTLADLEVGVLVVVVAVAAGCSLIDQTVVLVVVGHSLLFLRVMGGMVRQGEQVILELPKLEKRAVVLHIHHYSELVEVAKAVAGHQSCQILEVVPGKIAGHNH